MAEFKARGLKKTYYKNYKERIFDMGKVKLMIADFKAIKRAKSTSEIIVLHCDHVIKELQNMLDTSEPLKPLLYSMKKEFMMSRYKTKKKKD